MGIWICIGCWAGGGPPWIGAVGVSPGDLASSAMTGSWYAGTVGRGRAADGKTCGIVYAGGGRIVGQPAAGRGGAAGTSAGTLIGCLQIRHGTTLPRSAASTSMYFRHAGFGHRTAKTMTESP